MLRALSRVVLQPKRLGSLKWCEVNGNTFPENFCRSFYTLKPQRNALEEKYTLSKRVLEYMRENPKYATSVISLPDPSELSSTVNNSGIYHMLLVIAHSTESKPKDVLQLFNLYRSQQQHIIQDIITNKSLMSMVKERVLQMIPQMTQDDLKNFAVILNDLNYGKSRYLIDIVSSINKEFSQRASQADLEQCLELFDILLLLHDNNIHRRKKHFDVFMSLFESHTATAKPHHLAQILYYIGLAKKQRLNKESVQLLINRLEEVFEHLSFMDAGIALEGIFKCGVKLSKRPLLIKEAAKHLQAKIEKSDILSTLEAYAFVAMVKVIRAAKYQDRTLLSSVSTFIMNSPPNTLQLEIIAHTLALYANSQIYDPDVFSKLENLVLQHLSKPSQIVRVKDISRILWSFSHVGYKGSDYYLKTMEEVLKRLMHMGELNIYPEHFSGSLFSLAVLGYYPKELIKEAFNPHNIEKLQGYQRSKQLSRLLALHEAIRIEVPDITAALPETYINDLPQRTLSDEMLYRPALAHLMKGANFINKSVGTSVLKLMFPVPYINYSSLIYDTRGLKIQNVSENFILHELTNINEAIGANKVALEIIDSHSLLFESNNVVGIVRMKLRLMSRCGWIVQKVFEGDVCMYNSDEQTMAAFILEILSKIKT